MSMVLIYLSRSLLIYLKHFVSEVIYDGNLYNFIRRRWRRSKKYFCFIADISKTQITHRIYALLKNASKCGQISGTIRMFLSVCQMQRGSRIHVIFRVKVFGSMLRASNRDKRGAGGRWRGARGICKFICNSATPDTELLDKCVVNTFAWHLLNIPKLHVCRLWTFQFRLLDQF